MKFNPPPNWPQLPAGWTPPPGWQPDPSWPQPPYGWRLWIADDENVTRPYRATSRPAQPIQPWHQRTVFVVLLLIFFFPVGLILLWLRQDWSVQRRGIITAVVGVVVLIAALSQAPPKTKAPAPVRTSVAPVHTTKAPQPVQTTVQKQSCYPLTNSGNCYKPGEFCRTSDHGVHGIDASGDPIVCENNDGWRWERD